MASAPMFTDVRDAYSRNAVESTQAFPSGSLFYNATPGRNFYPYKGATKLAAAIAFVKAAGLSSQAASATLPLTVSDASSIPTAWRGHVAVALQRGRKAKLVKIVWLEPGHVVRRIEIHPER